MEEGGERRVASEQLQQQPPRVEDDRVFRPCLSLSTHFPPLLLPRRQKRLSDSANPIETARCIPSYISRFPSPRTRPSLPLASRNFDDAPSLAICLWPLAPPWIQSHRCMSPCAGPEAAGKGRGAISSSIRRKRTVSRTEENGDRAGTLLRFGEEQGTR